VVDFLLDIDRWDVDGQARVGAVARSGRRYLPFQTSCGSRLSSRGSAPADLARLVIDEGEVISARDVHALSPCSMASTGVGPVERFLGATGQPLARLGEVQQIGISV